MSPARACALAALAAIGAYWGTLENGFTWDDHVHIEAAPFVQDAGNMRVLLTPAFWTGRTPVQGGVRPLLLASLLADRAAWGNQPAGYHLTNVVLHAACAAALAGLAWLLLGSGELALLAGALFALHPVQSEAVCEITFRADLLSALGVLLALISLRVAFTRRSAAWCGAAAACFLVGLLAKESAVVLPALALLTEALFPTGSAARKTRLTAAILMAAALAAYAAFRLPRGGYEERAAPASPGLVDVSPAGLKAAGKTSATTQMEESPQEWKTAMRDPKTRFLTMSGIFGDYARLVLWPSGLQADRSAPTASKWLAGRAWIGWAFLLLILGAGWRSRRRLPAAALGLAWFLTALAPVSDVVALPNLIAERYLYLAVAGAALAAAAALGAAASRFRSPRAALLAVSAAVLVPAAAVTRARVPAWRDDAALFGTSPVTDNARLRYNRGLLAHRAGRYDEAEAEYRRALDLNPTSVEALVNLADVERARGRPAERLADLRRAVAAAPGSSVAFEALGDALEESGKGKEALAAYGKAINLDVQRPSPRRRRALALGHAGRFGEALKDAEAAVALDPTSAVARYEMGRLAQEARKLPQAVDAYRGAVRLDPKNGLAWANLGVCLHQSGDPAAALASIKLAVSLLPASADARRNLGAVLDDLGRLPEAQAAYEEATRLDPSSAVGWHGYGVVLQKQGLAGPAADAYRHALAVDPDKIESLANLASLRAGAGDLNEATALMERAAALRPGDPTLRAASDALLRRRDAAAEGK